MTDETETMLGLDPLQRPRVSIFVDANVLIPMFSKKDVKGLETLDMISKAGKARLLTTDITKVEVAKNLAEMDCDLLRPIEKGGIQGTCKANVKYLDPFDR